MGWLGYVLKNAESRIDHERKVVETIDHLERLSMLRETATSGLLQQQMFMKDAPTSRRLYQTFGQYLEQIPIEMQTVLGLVEDEPEASADAEKLQRVLQMGVQEMVFERDLYLSGKDDAYHVMSLNGLSHSASQLTKRILDHYRNLEQEAVHHEVESRANLRSALYVVVGLNIVIVLGLGALFISGVLKRLNIVTENSRKLALGNPLSAPMKGTDEIATIDQFHQMAKRGIEDSTQGTCDS